MGAIGGTEIMHFQTWQDKAGNAPELKDNHGREIFPALPHGPALGTVPYGDGSAIRASRKAMCSRASCCCSRSS